MRREKSIAVLPFANLSPHEEDELFCDGITEEIINALAKINDVFVTSRTSSFFFKNQDLNVTEIAEKLGVRFVVEGSVRRAGDNIRVTVQLINAEDDYHYWSDNFDRKLENIFQIQDEIGLAVQEKFRELTGHFEIDQNRTKQNGSLEVYELILRAKQYSTDLSEHGIQIGFELLEQALQLEPNNAKVLGTKAGYYAALGIIGVFPILDASEKAIEAADAALAIDPNIPEALSIKGLLEFILSGDLDKAYYHLEKAINIGSNDPGALLFLALIESAIGKYDEAMNAIDLAAELDPLSLLPNYFRCMCLLRLRKYDEAEEETTKFLKNYPNHLNIYNVMGHIYLRTGRAKLALAHFTKMPMMTGEKIPYYGGMAQAFALLGNISEAEEHIDLALENDHRLRLTYMENPEVVVNFLLSKFEEGFKHLAKDVKSNAYYLRYYRTNPLFDAILSDPRAKILDDIIKDNGIQDSEDKQKYAKSGLSDEEIEQLSSKLGELMKAEKPYLDPELSLKKLASMLDVTPNNLSQVINSQKNKNFFDYVNGYRIKELIANLNDEGSKQFTILSLAMDAGFNSKSAFNASFKKLTSMTPSEYLKSINKSEIS